MSAAAVAARHHPSMCSRSTHVARIEMKNEPEFPFFSTKCTNSTHETDPLTSCLSWIHKLILSYHRVHGQRTPRESFFSKIQNFWAWADKLGRNFMRHLGYFWPNYKHYFGTVSPLSIGKSSWFSFLQKTLVFRSKKYNSQILPK